MDPWPPDDPRWLTVEPEIELVDLQVLRQVGVPEPILQLAMRRAANRSVDPGSSGRVVGSIQPVVHADLSFLDELEEDPDARPYTWDLPDEGCPGDYRRW